ncbi:MAG: hypothetical protein V1904_05105 [Bacteroidota bacterium]
MKTFLVCILLVAAITSHAQKNDEKLYTKNLMQDSCTFATSGSNTYFILQPGFQLVLQGIDEKDTVILKITVLNETKIVDSVETRIVEEYEAVNGIPIEISRNYYAFCKETGSIFYFGEDVDMYKNGVVSGHETAWLAGGQNKAGVQMPGIFMLGSRYYQEIAPGVAMDRAEILSISDSLKTPCGTFYNCLKTEEGTALNPKEKEYKIYAPGVGLLKDEELLLVKYGYIKY